MSEQAVDSRIESIDDFLKSVSGGGSPPCEIVDSDRLLVIRFYPVVMSMTWSQLERLGTHLQSIAHKDCLCDLSTIDYIGSTFVALLVRLYKSVHDEHHQFGVITGSNLSINEALGLAGLDKVWKLYKTHDEALLAFGRPLGGSQPRNWLWKAIWG